MDDRYEIRAIVSNTGSNAQAVAKEFQAAYSSTDFDEVLRDKEVDVVLISTRHNTHASMTLTALRAGKHVFVEKPLALNESELREIETFFETKCEEALPILMTGFNRRFSPAMVMAREIMSARTASAIIDYRMNAGFIPPDHWVHQPEGGGRNIGEACHIYDLFTFLTNETLTDVRATGIRPNKDHYGPHDNFVATSRFNDGSVATLTYTSMGSKDYPKETMEIFADGKVITMTNFESAQVIGLPRKKVESKVPEKGLKQELERFSECIRNGKEWPIPLWQQLQAMRIAFAVEGQLRDEGGRSECAASPAR
jgi:predicted dehydrogenase